MTLAPGQKLGPYEVVGPLGAGGMGEVWRARDARLGREVAIKVLPADVASDPSRLARFEREARAVEALNHPNIVVLHSVEDADGVRFLTMELVEGLPLTSLVEPGGVPVKKLLELSIPLADALAAAHARGVVHRDLKPANVMVTREGRVKVLDFGLAKQSGEDAALDATQAATVAAPLSQAGQVVGTVPYMSPEQLRGDRVDARSDLFSLGILVYELATGRRPFGGTSSADLSSAILRDVPAPARALRGELPADLERILARCLEKDPERRFQTAKDVRNELELVARTLDSAPASASVAVRPAAAAPPVREAPSIAVLPFENRSANADDEYFSEGLADELMGMLGKIRGLRVAARTSSRQFKGSSEAPAAIGTRLHVDTLLEGSVRKAGNRVRISVQLVGVTDGFHLWSETYDRTLDDIFAVQDEIAQAVVKELRAALLGEAGDSRASGEVRAEVESAAVGRGTSPEAHRLYLLGRFLYLRTAGDDLPKAVETLRRAVELDPGHALAWAALSSAETLSAGLGSERVATAMPRARACAQRALALAPDLAEAHMALATVLHWHDFDWQGARAEYERALALAPDNAEVLTSSAMLLYACGRFDEALARLERAIGIDPLGVPGHSHCGRIHYSAGRLEPALAAFRQALQISPGATAVRAMMSLPLAESGRPDEALAEAQAEPMEWARLWALGILHHWAGRDAESAAALAGLIERWRESALFQIACLHAVRGEADAAFEWLERAYAERDTGTGLTCVVSILRGLHADPRWRPFVRKIGLEG